jgi:hypothetical protein
VTLAEHVARTLADIPPGMRLPAYSPLDLGRLLRRGRSPVSPRTLAAVLPLIGWRKHRVWRTDKHGKRRLITLWVPPGATVNRNGIRFDRL